MAKKTDNRLGTRWVQKEVKGSEILFDQAETDKLLLADKRVRKMFFESFKEDLADCFLVKTVSSPKTFENWFNQKLKELE